MTFELALFFGVFFYCLPKIILAIDTVVGKYVKPSVDLKPVFDEIEKLKDANFKMEKLAEDTQKLLSQSNLASAVTSFRRQRL